MKPALISCLLYMPLLFLGCSTDNKDHNTPDVKIVIDEDPVLSPRTSPEWVKWQTDPCVIKVDNTWIMYFGCNNHGVLTQIGRATSTDGINWIVDTSGPVLSVGPKDAWDDRDVETPWVIYDPTMPADRRYKMWYSGQGNQGDNRPEYAYQIGYAYSEDGVTWTKYNDPANNGDLRFVESDPVFKTPTFVADGSMPTDMTYPYDGWTVAEPSVIVQNDGTYRMYYVGLGVDKVIDPVFRHRIITATSPDGINWTRYGVVLEPTLTGYESEGITCSSVVVRDGKHMLFYTMFDLDFSQFASIERGYTGLAISDDGVSFSRYSSLPIIGHGPYDSYYMSGSFAATPIIVDDQLYVYFSGLRFIEASNIVEFHIGRMSWIESD